jgi:hypothetical protein
MNPMKWLFAVLFVLTCTAITLAQPDKAAPPTIAQVLNSQLSNVEKEFVSAADAMPEEKYSFAPTSGEFKGVRTFAAQVKHVAAVNYLVCASILGEKPPVDLGGENGPEAIKTKADIMKFLKDSFAYAHKAFATMDEKNVVGPIQNPFGEGTAPRLGMATVIIGHCFDHYGQMVEYLRMNGIVPPASRGQ